MTTQIDLGAGYGPYIRAVQPNGVYTDSVRLDLCTNIGSNDATPIPRLTIRAGNVGIGTAAPGYPLSVGSTYGVMTSATFTLAGTSSVNTGYTLPAGGLYQVTVTSNSANGPGAGNSHWWWFGLVNFNNASFIGFPITINNNNVTISVATNGQVTVATPGGSGSFSWIISAVRLC